METRNATIRRDSENAYLVLESEQGQLELNLTDDNPNDVKAVFNKLLNDLKKRSFEFKLEDDSTDLFHSICEEYLLQLNAELKSVHKELSDYDLVEPINHEKDDLIEAVIPIRQMNEGEKTQSS